mmetsp:Transcript_105652/g.297190  ORF Transcript_105652/g.297190 Transcript_105652/m.297190 type:complete len:229 (-) Transcript_105652:1090-1776(-)
MPLMASSKISAIHGSQRQRLLERGVVSPLLRWALSRARRFFNALSFFRASSRAFIQIGCVRIGRSDGSKKEVQVSSLLAAASVAPSAEVLYNNSKRAFVSALFIGSLSMLSIVLSSDLSTIALASTSTPQIRSCMTVDNSMSPCCSKNSVHLAQISLCTCNLPNVSLCSGSACIAFNVLATIWRIPFWDSDCDVVFSLILASRSAQVRMPSATIVLTSHNGRCRYRPK